MAECQVNFEYDNEAKVWIATSDDVTGLVLESESLAKLSGYQFFYEQKGKFEYCIMTEYEKKVREILKQNGCNFVSHVKGDHDIYYSPITNNTFEADKKIKSRHTANAIMKQSGINCHF